MAPAADIDTIENRLGAARTRLILEKPFLGALALRLPLEAAAASWCAATHSDGRTFYYNPAYVNGLSFEQVQFVLSREALHCALSHFNRRGHRQPARWRQACEYSLNLILRDEGLQPPADALLCEEYLGLTAEEIYPLLEQTEQSEDETSTADNPPDGAGAPSGGGRQGAGADDSDDARLAPAPPPLSETARERLQQQWQQRLAGAAQQALQAGKMGAGMARLIELMLQPTLPWRAVLAQFMNGIARDDYSYARPSSRRGDPAIFPSLRSAQIDLVVAVDVSGSIDAGMLNEFMSEIDALKAQVRARVTLLACDNEITGDSPWVFEAWDRCQLPEKIDGGGGTDFRPVFDWVERRERPPDLLIFFTDAEGRFPEVEPAYPALWLVQGPGEVPWGGRIQLN